MDWVILGGLGAIVGIALWVLGKKKPGEKAAPPTDGEGEQGSPPPYEPPPAGSRTAPEAPERGTGPGPMPPGFMPAPPPTPPLPPVGIGPRPPATVPGKTPETAVGSHDLFKGFQGYFLVEEPDSLSKIAARLGTTHNELRDHPANLWAKEACPKWVKDKYNSGRDTIALLPRYGKTLGFDCISAPGYRAALYSKYTGQQPVLYWGDTEGWN